MALPKTDISISLVKKTVGAPTYALTDIIGNAKSGGSAGEAFDSAGELISGAETYWNKFAAHIPGDWTLDGTDLKLGLPVLDVVTFQHMLGRFRQYNHNAPEPRAIIPSEQSCFAGTINVAINADLGEWALPSAITHLLIKVTIGVTTKTLLLARADVWHDESGDPVEGNLIQFTGVSTGTTSGTIKVYGSNSSSDELTDLTPWMTGETTFSFDIIHSSEYGTLSRTVGGILDDVEVSGSVTDPSGAGDIQIAAGTTKLDGIIISATATSASYTNFSVDLYVTQSGESNKLVGTYAGTCSPSGVVNAFIIRTLTLNSAVAGGDVLTFLMSNLTYS